jgi:hypothetical protein
MLDVQKELRTRDDKIKELEGKLIDKSERTTIIRGFTFKIEANDEISDLPLCPKCEKIDKVFIRVVKESMFKARCPHCRNEYACDTVGNPDGPTIRNIEAYRRSSANSHTSRRKNASWMP